MPISIKDAKDAIVVVYEALGVLHDTHGVATICRSYFNVGAAQPLRYPQAIEVKRLGLLSFANYQD
jgi:hypothetical protein